MSSKSQSVYVSYAWDGECEALVDAFESKLPPGLKLVRDKRALRPGDWISKFEKEIGQAALVLVVISEKYLRSIYCMRELLYLYQSSLGERDVLMAKMVPLIVGDLACARAKQRDVYVQYWEAEYAELDAILKRRSLDTVGEADRGELLAIQDFKQVVSDLLFWIANTLMPRGESLASEGIDAAISLFNERAQALGITLSEPSEPDKDPIGGDSGAKDRPQQPDDSHQTARTWDSLRRNALERLQNPGASVFLEAALADYRRKVETSAPPRSARDLVEHFASCSPQSADDLLFVVRRALDAVKFGHPQDLDRAAVENAAVALYCLAACRFVDETRLSAGYLQQIWTSESLICGLVATVLTGLKLRLDCADDSGSPCPPHVYEVPIPPGSEADADAFERAAYLALFPNRSDAQGESLDYGPLPNQKRSELSARIRTILKKDEETVALLVRERLGHTHITAFANTHKVPVLLFSPEVTSALVGIDEDTFLADTRVFWLEVVAFRDAHRSNPRSSTKHPGEPMTEKEAKTTIIFNAPVQNAALSTESHSTAQAGSHQTAHVEHREGTEAAVLIDFSWELLAAIQALAADKGRAVLEQMTDAVMKEAAKGRQADGKKIMDSLKAIEATGKAFDAGAKIIELCNRGYQILGPIFGLPVSPF